MEVSVHARTMSASLATAETQDGDAWRKIEERRKTLNRNELFILRRIERSPFGQTIFIRQFGTLRRDPNLVTIMRLDGTQYTINVPPGKNSTDLAYKTVAHLAANGVQWKQVILPDFD